MKKIWAKVLTHERRIQKDMIYVLENPYEKDDIYSYVSEICQSMHMPTPIVISSHIDMFDEYSYVRFVSHDFVEGVDFFALTLESGD